MYRIYKKQKLEELNTFCCNLCVLAGLRSGHPRHGRPHPTPAGCTVGQQVQRGRFHAGSGSGNREVVTAADSLLAFRTRFPTRNLHVIVFGVAVRTCLLSAGHHGHHTAPHGASHFALLVRILDFI